ncbi:MAG: hypothetical protein [Caudoviricetes sp.]|nr:MAG: hypothetical protein [Caudoviricetes sp.]
MKRVNYEQYLMHIGFGHYLYKHTHTDTEHTTEVINLNNSIVAKIVRGEETEYYIS